MGIQLPPRQVHETPRLLAADAYTIGSNEFESSDAQEKSIYYITMRSLLKSIDPVLYGEDDDRLIFTGLSRILEKLFYDPVTHEEIDETKRFLKTAKATTMGLKPYSFPEELWRRVVDEFNGRPPIQVRAFPQGSVYYPNEPCVIIESMVEGFGILAAWFESKCVQIWGPTERVTQNEHWFLFWRKLIAQTHPGLSKEQVDFKASLMLTDFGDRAGLTFEESEELGMYHLLTFPGTDTFAGAYQAWKNSNEVAQGFSVKALAHRNVQAYEHEGDCYQAIYDAAEPGDITSDVSDCYDFKYAVEHYLVPIALESVRSGKGVVTVSRPDSGDALDQILFIIKTAIKYGLYTEVEICGKKWKVPTTLKFIEGDGMTFKAMMEIAYALLAEGFLPWEWGLFGVGGGLRNGLKRDNTSTKYALCSVGNRNHGVVKASEVVGKSTLPGPFKVIRTPEALASKKTIVKLTDPNPDAHVLYFDGSNLEKPFGEGQYEDFPTWKQRIRDTFDTMPLNVRRENTLFSASDEILEERLALLNKYKNRQKSK